MISNARIVAKTPLITTLLLEGANVGQLVRMWTEHSAKDQSLTAWLMVFVALLLWYNYFRVVTPDQKIARRCQAFGCVMNAIVCLTVLHFRGYIL